MIDLGTIRPGTTLYIPFASYAGATGASVTLSGLAATDIEIYKDGSTTQRASDNGYTLLDTDGIDFDGVTGLHGFSIDLADNSTAGFYAAGSQYWVVVSTVTIDGQTVTFIAATFRIGYSDAVINTTIATLSSQTSFTLTSGPAEDDALNGMWAIIHDVASAVQKAVVQILDYTGSTKTVTLAAGATFTAAATDNISIMGPMPLQPTTTGRPLDVSSGGEAGVDWANVGTPGSTVSLSATTLNLVTGLTNLPSIPANWLTAAGTAADFATEIRTAVNGGDYALSTDANGRIRIVDGTGTGELDTSSGTVLVGDFTTAAKALLQTEAEDALVVHRLDELLNADSDIDGAAPPTVGSVFHELMTKTAGSFTYDQTTDSLEALRDNTGTAGAGLTAADDAVLAAIAALNDFDPGTDAVVLADNVTHGGSNAKLWLGSTTADSAFWVSSSGGCPVLFESSDFTSPAVRFLGGAIAIDLDCAATNMSGVGISSMASGTINSTSFSLGAITADALNADAATEIATAVWALATRTLTAIDEDTTTLDLDATIRAAVGLSSANLGTLLSDIDTVVDAILADTGTDGVVVNAAGLQTDAVQEIRNSITGYAGPMNLDASGNAKISDGTGSNQLGLTNGFIDGITGTINTLDALDTAQDLEHDATQAAIAALNNLSTVQVLAQVETALATTTRAMPGQVTPSSTPTLVEAIMQRFQLDTNPTDQNSSIQRVYNRAGSVVQQKRAATDDTITAALGALVTGP